MKLRIRRSLEICRVPHWAKQLADLTRVAWTGESGQCFFPHKALIDRHHWLRQVHDAWQFGVMDSWVMVEGERIVAHVALLSRDFKRWELGRWVAFGDAPHGAVTSLCERALSVIQRGGESVVVETTQAHTSSQFICRKLGMRFAGVGILKKEHDGIAWDIIFFDNVPGPDFQPKAGLIGDPWGDPLRVEPQHRKRLQQIGQIITTDRGGILPPIQFHILPELKAAVEEIVRLNT